MKKTNNKVLIALIIIIWGILIIEAVVLSHNEKFRRDFPFFPNFPLSLKNTNPLSEFGVLNKTATVFFEQFSNELYGEYYNIEKVYAYDYEPEEVIEEETNENAQYFIVVIQKKLKYDNVYNLPFVKGMTETVNELKNRKANTVYNAKVQELKQYVNATQYEYNIFKVTFNDDEKNFNTASVTIATYHNETSAEELKPPTAEVLYEEGAEFIKSVVKVEKGNVEYLNEWAIEYADKYTSNPVNKNSDENAWNNEYLTYENDCANYVSQCIKAGGIDETDDWYPNSLLWIRTGSPRYSKSGVTDYMQSNNMFFNTSYSGISAGGFICLVEESHVVMVTSNDSITLLFNGHTNDRKRVSFPRLNSNEAIYLTPNNLF